MPRLSLCLIVRDEEAMLPGLLASVDGLWDELIAADTGSTDGTADLLRAAGATVVAFPWADDFAAARNASLEPATGDWILFLDADERVTPELAAEIRTVLDDGGAGAATVVMRNRLPGGHHRDANLLRLFRNDPEVRFRHRIHEDVLDDVEAFLARTGLAMRHLTGVVDHLGYVRDVTADTDKRARDQALLERTLADDPDDFYCWFKLLELARFWDDRKLWEATAKVLAPRLEGDLDAAQVRTLKRNPWSGELAALVVEGLGLEPAAALNRLNGLADRVWNGAAWHWARGTALEQQENASDAGQAFAAALADTADGASHHHVRAQMGLCRLHVAGGHLTKAVDCAREALQISPADPEALLAQVTLSGNPAEGAAWLGRHVATHPHAAGAAATALLEQGHAAPALDLLAAAAPTDPPLAMGQLTCALALGVDVDLQTELDQDAADQAFRHWISVLWNSRRTNLMTTFAENCGSVTGIFPWLEEFLEAETARLRGG